MLCAAGAAGLLAVVGVLSFRVSRVADWDSEAFRGFWMMQRPALAPIEQAVAHSVSVSGFAVIVAALAAVALLRRQPRLVGIMALILLGSNLSTQALKGVLPAHDTLVAASPVITGPSFPSGHTTACMSLVLCAVIVAPARWRSAVAVAGLLYSLAVAYSVLVLASHFPSDVIAGFLMACLWALVGLAFRGIGGSRRRERVPRAWSAATPLVWVGSLAIALAGVGVALGPKQVSPVPFTVSAALIALVAVASVGSVTELSIRFDRRGTGAMRG